MKLKKTAAALLAVMIAASVPLTGTENNGISITASAATTSQDRLWSYETNSDNVNTVKLIKYLGSSKDVDIPETIGAKKVTVIDSKFINSLPATIETISIPKTVTTVTEEKKVEPFGHITSLKEITVDAANTSLCSQDGVLYKANDNSKYGTLIACPRAKTGSLEVPSGVVEIKAGAFYGSQLTSVKLPNTVTTIWGYSEFYRSTGAFEGAAIKSIVLSNSLTSISGQTFYKCANLETITIPDSVTSIGESAFRGCTSLKSIVIPDSVTSMGDYVLGGCTALEQVRLSPNSNIPYCGFIGCSSLTRLLIPEGVTRVNGQCFNGCINLEVVSIPSTLTYVANIGQFSYGAFAQCANLLYAYYNGTMSEFSKLIQEGVGSAKYSVLPDQTVLVERRDFEDAETGVIVSDGAGALPGVELEDCTVTASSKDIANGKRYTINATNLNKATFPFSMGNTVTIKIPIPEEYKYNILTVMQGNTKIDAEKKDGYMVFKANKLNCDYDIVISDVSVGVEVSVKAPAGTDTSGQKVTVTGNGVNKEITVTNGQLDISGLADGTYTFTFSANNCAPRNCDVTVASGAVTGLDKVELHLLGDINGDGVVNTQDVAKANAHVKGTSTLTGYDLACINVNNDANINVQDVALMNAHAKNTKLLW